METRVISQNDLQCAPLIAKTKTIIRNRQWTTEELAKLGYHTSEEYAATVAAYRKEWFEEIDRLDHVVYTDKDFKACIHKTFR